VLIKNSKNNGFAAIASLLVISAIILVIGISVSLLSVSGLTQSLSTYKSNYSLNLVESCVEKALSDLNQNDSLSTSYSLPEGDCQLTINQNGPDWDFTVEGSFDDYSHQIRIKANKSSTISINSWQIVE
jgi:hypothetical protein